MSLPKILLASLSLALAASSFGQSVASVKFDPASFSPLQSTTGTVFLSAPAAAGLTVNLSSSKSGFDFPSTVSVAPGESSANFVVISTFNGASSSVITVSGGGTSRKAVVSADFSPWLSFSRASAPSTDAQANNHSGEPYKSGDGDSHKISGDGRYVVFTSQATNLVASDKNRKSDVFLRDRQLGTTVRVSQLSTGVEANGNSYQPCISSDGNQVAFVSDANNLVTGDTNGQPDVFLWKRATGAISLVSRNGAVAGNDASFQPAISKDGKFVAYETWATNLTAKDDNGWADIYVYNSAKGTSARASIGYNPWTVEEPNGDSGAPSISADGRYVAFESFADNLVPNDSNVCEDVFVRDMTSNSTARASISPDGLDLDGFSFSPSISADGRIVAFCTYAPIINMEGYFDDAAKILVRDMTLPNSTVGVDLFYADAIEPSISADGRFIAFVNYNYSSNTFGACDVYDRLYRSGTIIQGQGTDVSLSSDGKYAVFTSSTRGLTPDDTNGKDDIFVAEVGGQAPVAIDGSGENGQIHQVVAGDTISLTLRVKQAPKSPLKVALTSFGSGITVPASVTIPTGKTSVVFKATTSLEAYQQFAGVNATCNSRTIGTGIPVGNGELTLSANQVKAGATLTAKVRIATAPTSPMTFIVWSNGFAVPASVKISAGQKTKSFTISVPANTEPGYYYIQVYSPDYFFNGSVEVVK